MGGEADRPKGRTNSEMRNIAVPTGASGDTQSLFKISGYDVLSRVKERNSDKIYLKYAKSPPKRQFLGMAC